MAGFQLPITAIPPQLLAEMARGAFRPPALMSAGGGGGMGGGMGALPQSPGFNLGQSIAGMGPGLGMLAGALNQPSIEAKTKGQMLSPSNASYGDLGGPGGTYGQGGGGWFSNLFGGGRADGGEVVPGKYYTVGEQGPETFVPAVPGTIVPDRERYIDNYAAPSGGRYIDNYAPPSGGRYIDNYAPPSGGRYIDNYTPGRDFFGGRARR